MKTATLDFTKDTVTFLDDEWYTTIGVLKVMCVCKATLSNEIKNKKIEVFRHPNGNLFSKDAVNEWRLNRTSSTKKKTR